MIIVLIFFLVFIWFFYGFCGKQQIALNWVILRVFQFNFVGFLGVGKWSFNWFRVTSWGGFFLRVY